MNKVAKRIVVWGALVMAMALFGACPPNGLLTDLQDKVRNPLKSAIGSGNRKPLSHSANPLSQTML
jgi:hypothetical protein